MVKIDKGFKRFLKSCCKCLEVEMPTDKEILRLLKDPRASWTGDQWDEYLDEMERIAKLCQ
jgi:hypothetical protein